jgi:hypothetical protein
MEHMHITRVIPALTIGLVLMSGVAQAQTPTRTTNSNGITDGVNTSANGTSTMSDTTSGMGTTTGSTGATINTTPGTPNTGVGGEATSNMVALMVSAAVALLGGAYLVRTRHG